MRWQRLRKVTERWLALAILLLAMACVAPDTTLVPDVTTPPTYPPAAVAAPANKLGIHLLLDDGRNVWPTPVWPLHLGRARQAVGEWGYVTQLVRLDDLHPVRWQHFMDLCAELHMIPVLRLATTYDLEVGWWEVPPRDDDGTYRTVATRYTDFVVALDWPTDEHYIVVGNEPNRGDEWGGRPDPEAYARFLIDVADALHAVDPGARVLNAGFDPYAPHTGSQPFINGMVYMDEETFLDRMYAAYSDVFDCLDAWASHAYPTGPMAEGPWVQIFQIDLINDAVNPDHVEPPQGIYNRGVNGYGWELFKLSTYGVAPLPVMITETGWRHAESVDPEAADGGAFPDAKMVATYLDLALRGNDGRYPEYPEDGWTPWLDDPRVVAVTLFALDGLPAEWGYTNLLVLDVDGEVLGTYAPFDLLATESAQP